MSELLACPFCGGTETVVSRNQHWTGMRYQILSVEIRHWCHRDGVKQGYIVIKGKTEDEAIDTWNKRQ